MTEGRKMTEHEINELRDRLRPISGGYPISADARRRFVHMEDGDDAHDLALDYDEDVRLGFDWPVDRIEDR